MTEQGTLKELNVKPGDVVEVISEAPWWTPGKEYLVSSGRQIFDDQDDERDWDETFVKARIISRAAQPTSTPDLTAITTPFGLLDAATQEALRAHGGPYEWWNGEVWNYAEKACAFSSASPAFAYRVKPEPKRETVTDDRWLIPHNGNISFDEMTDRTPVRVTFDRVDGKIDLSTYKVEPR